MIVVCCCLGVLRGSLCWYCGMKMKELVLLLEFGLLSKCIFFVMVVLLLFWVWVMVRW